MKQMTIAEIDREILAVNCCHNGLRGKGRWDGTTYIDSFWSERSRCWIEVPAVFYWCDEPIEVVV